MGRKVNEMEYSANDYKQFNHNYIGNLSIIDVMMFNSKREISVILEKYVLV